MRPAFRILVAIIFISAVKVCLGPGSVEASRRASGAVSAPEVAAFPDWLDPQWWHRVKVTANPAMIDGTLLDFPLLLDGSVLQDVFPYAKSDGSDILITKRDGVTILDHEIVSYDSTQGRAEIWFAADTLSAQVNEFYVYFDNPAAEVVPSGSVWNADYLAVYHFEEDPGAGTLFDYTAAGNHASSSLPGSNWTSADVTSGKIGQGWLFNGTTHYINTNRISTQDSSFVVSCWVDNTTRTVDFAFQSNPGFWHVSTQINPTHSRPHYNAANPWRDFRWGPHPLPLDGEFHLFTWVFDGVADTMLFYFDGVEQPAEPWSKDPEVVRYYTGHPINPSGTDRVGILGPMYYNPEDLMDGRGDEFRVSQGLHSGTWITTEYRNQSDPGGFFFAGPVEEAGANPVLLLAFEVEWLDEAAHLHWGTALPSPDHAGFHVYRDTGSESWTRLTAELLSGVRDYDFIDREPPAEGASYWLAETSVDGAVVWYGPAVLTAATTSGFALQPNRPNPFIQATSIRFIAAQRGDVRLRIFDVRGRHVRTLLDGPVTRGSHAVIWDGRDTQGIRMQPGVYLVRLESMEGVITGKLILM